MKYYTYTIKIQEDNIVAWGSVSDKAFIVAEVKLCVGKFIEAGYYNLSVEIVEKVVDK